MPNTDQRSAQPRRSTQKGERGERVDLYAEVTDKIIAELEAGRFPWVQPWGVSGADASPGAGPGPGLPRNALTERTYSGVNILILWGAVIERGYAEQSWLTFRQAQDAGGAVIKGERGVTVVYADRFVPKGESERAARDGDDAKAVPFLKRFTVSGRSDAGAAERRSGHCRLRRPHRRAQFQLSHRWRQAGVAAGAGIRRWAADLRRVSG